MDIQMKLFEEYVNFVDSTEETKYIFKKNYNFI